MIYARNIIPRKGHRHPVTWLQIQMAGCHDRLIRLSSANALHRLMQGIQRRGARGVNTKAWATEIKIVRDASSHDRLVVARNIEHRRLLQITEGAESIVRRVAADKNANLLANNLLLGDPSVFNCLVRAFKQESLLGVCQYVSNVTSIKLGHRPWLKRTHCLRLGLGNIEESCVK